MSLRFETPWHKRSYDRALEERLPQLLAARVPLACYAVTADGPHTCQINLSISSATNGDVALTYDGIPRPDEKGLFWRDGAP